MPLLPGAHPWSADGGPVGVLFCHGFTGSPQSLRPWAQAVAAAGHAVELPRLPGHGTSWQELARTSWTDWETAADRAHDALAARCDRVVVAGLSMGGALALRVAQRHPEVRGAVLVNPFVTRGTAAMRAAPVLQVLRRSAPGIASDIKRPGAHETGYDRVPLASVAELLRLTAAVRAGLHRVQVPVLLLRSAVDHVVAPDSGELLVRHLGTDRVEEHVLADSFHVATLDNDLPTIVERTLGFVDRVTAGAAPGASRGAVAAGGAP